MSRDPSSNGLARVWQLGVRSLGVRLLGLVPGRLLRRGLGVDPAVDMEMLVGALARSSGGDTFEELRRLHAECRERDPRSKPGHSTRIEDCLFLYLLVRALRPRAAFEVGTLIGSSATAIALGQRDAGGGRLFTVDASYGGFEPDPGLEIETFPLETSEAALDELRERGVRVEFAFVDGSLARADVDLLRAVASPDLVVALHDFKPPNDKGVQNALLLRHGLPDAAGHVWVLPERQGKGYAVGATSAINSSIAVRFPRRVLERLLEDAPPAPT